MNSLTEKEKEILNQEQVLDGKDMQGLARNIYEHTYNIAKPFIDNFRNALDIGARKGESWENMCPDFESIHCFEPRCRYRPIFKGMMKKKEKYRNRVTLHHIALGETAGTVSINTFGVIIDKKQCRYLEERKRKTEAVEQRRLDDYNFENIDYMKIDVEGHELDVLKGGTETIKKYHPVVVLEQNHTTEEYNKGGKFDALNYLRSLGYELVAYDLCTDYVLKYKHDS